MTGRHGLYAELLTRFAKLDFEPQIVSIKKPQKWCWLLKLDIINIDQMKKVHLVEEDIKNDQKIIIVLEKAPLEVARLKKH